MNKTNIDGITLSLANPVELALRWVGQEELCTPVMGVNLWGASPLYGESSMSKDSVNQVLAEGKGVSARRGLEEAGAQSYEPTNRNSIQGHHPGKSAQHDEVPRIQEKW